MHPPINKSKYSFFKVRSYERTFGSERRSIEELAKVTQLETLELKFEELEAENRIILNISVKQPSHHIKNDQQNGFLQNSKTSVKTIGIMPKSCAGLQYMEHTANGLYLFMGTEKGENVFCHFT